MVESYAEIGNIRFVMLKCFFSYSATVGLVMSFYIKILKPNG